MIKYEGTFKGKKEKATSLYPGRGKNVSGEDNSGKKKSIKLFPKYLPCFSLGFCHKVTSISIFTLHFCQP